MNPPKDQAELDLVILAIRSHHTTGCCEWHLREAERVKKQGLPLPEMTTITVRALLVFFVINQHGLIEQMEEKRPHYSDRDFWYRAVIPVAGLPRGLFVEIVMDDPDPDCPAVIIVNAHIWPKPMPTMPSQFLLAVHIRGSAVIAGSGRFDPW